MEASFDAAKMDRLTVFAITEREGVDRAFWTKVGAAFKNRDGSYNILLDALPTHGKLHMRFEDPQRARPTRPPAHAARGQAMERELDLEVRS